MNQALTTTNSIEKSQKAKKPETIAEKREWLINNLFAIVYNARDNQFVDTQTLKDLTIMCNQALIALRESEDRDQNLSKNTSNKKLQALSTQEINQQISAIFRKMQAGTMAIGVATEKMKVLSLMVSTIKDLSVAQAEVVSLHQPDPELAKSIKDKINLLEQSIKRGNDEWEHVVVSAYENKMIDRKQLHWLATEVVKRNPKNTNAIKYVEMINEALQKKSPISKGEAYQ